MPQDTMHEQHVSHGIHTIISAHTLHFDMETCLDPPLPLSMCLMTTMANFLGIAVFLFSTFQPMVATMDNTLHA